MKNDERRAAESETRRRVLMHIDSEFDSDAAFEREIGLPAKTVNNWRRGMSSSFMKILPRLADCFECTVSELLDMPITHTGGALSDEELRLLTLYRRSRDIGPKQREALTKTLEQVIEMYLESLPERKRSRNK